MVKKFPFIQGKWNRWRHGNLLLKRNLKWIDIENFKVETVLSLVAKTRRHWWAVSTERIYKSKTQTVNKQFSRDMEVFYGIRWLILGISNLKIFNLILVMIGPNWNYRSEIDFHKSTCQNWERVIVSLMVKVMKLQDRAFLVQCIDQ